MVVERWCEDEKRKNGLLTVTNDRWIAAAALAHDLGVVTKNEEHYRRVAGLRLRSYGTPA